MKAYLAKDGFSDRWELTIAAERPVSSEGAWFFGEIYATTEVEDSFVLEVTCRDMMPKDDELYEIPVDVPARYVPRRSRYRVGRVGNFLRIEDHGDGGCPIASINVENLSDTCAGALWEGLRAECVRLNKGTSL